jgi:uncharacterized membrane protein
MTAKKKTAPAPKQKRLQRHFYQHHRFYIGAAGAIAAFAATAGNPLAVRGIAAGDAFFLIYLLLLGLFAVRSTPDSTMTHARVEDEGVLLVTALTLGAVISSLTAIFTLVTSSETVPGWAIGAAIASVPLGWATVHASAALHYSRLYYAQEEDGGSREGLEFPCDEEPDVVDFLYFSFVLGMTAQTSDVEISGRRMRRSVLVHSIVAFFYNTVILALSVNAAVQLAG